MYRIEFVFRPEVIKQGPGEPLVIGERLKGVDYSQGAKWGSVCKQLS